MCLPKPKVPDQTAQVDESRRQFDIEQERLAEREAAQAAEAERQRAIEEQRALEDQRAIDAQRMREQEERDREEQQRQREAAAARQKVESIDQATGAVNSGFSGFDDNYFQEFTNDYLGYYNPKIERQAEDARREAQFELARRGTLDSTAAVGVYTRLAERQKEEQARVAREAAQAAANLRSSVAASRSNLLTQAVNSGGQGDFVSLAQETASGIKPPALEPIGELFAGLVAPTAQETGGTVSEALEGGVLPTAAQAARVVRPQPKKPVATAAPGLVF